MRTQGALTAEGFSAGVPARSAVETSIWNTVFAEFIDLVRRTGRKRQAEPPLVTEAFQSNDMEARGEHYRMGISELRFRNRGARGFLPISQLNSEM